MTVRGKKQKNEATTVASPRSRLANDKDKTKLKAGERHQQEFTKFIKALLKGIETKLEVEPNASNFHDILNKKDKKKLN